MATKVEIRPLRLCDVWAFEGMRPEDAAEIMASGGYSPVQAIIESWACSREAYGVWFNGEPACVFGVSQTTIGTELSPVGVAWLLTTPSVDRHPIAFWRTSKAVVKDLVERYGTLLNFVDARYARSIEWARRLGFSVSPAVPFGKAGLPFHPIIHGGRHV